MPVVFDTGFYGNGPAISMDTLRELIERFDREDPCVEHIDDEADYYGCWGAWYLGQSIPP